MISINAIAFADRLSKFLTTLFIYAREIHFFMKTLVFYPSTLIKAISHCGQLYWQLWKKLITAVSVQPGSGTELHIFCTYRVLARLYRICSILFQTNPYSFGQKSFVQNLYGLFRIFGIETAQLWLYRFLARTGARATFFKDLVQFFSVQIKPSITAFACAHIAHT